MTDTSIISLLEVARSYLAAGLCVLPADLKDKRPAVPAWKLHQTRLPIDAEIAGWFPPGGANALCIVAGRVSGGLEMLDFDCQAEAFERWRELVEAEAPGLVARLVIERSQGHGMHACYRFEGIVPGSVKLAEKVCVAADPDSTVFKGKKYVARRVGEYYEYCPTLIETRGEGGLFLCAPSPGYVLEQGRFEEMPVITATEREVMLRCARSFNERPEMAPAPRLPPAAGERPGDEYNQRGEVRDVLRRHGWTLARSGGNEHWRRPGKDHGWSATYNGQVFYCFTSSAPPLDLNRGYSRFQVYALLEHAGDYSAAAGALRAQGYGGGVPASGGQGAEALVPSFVSINRLLRDHPQLRKPLVHGLLREGETMNVIAPPKAGKSWLVTDLALSVATGRPWLGLFQTVRGCVLVLDNELHHETTAHRVPRVAQARGIDLSEVSDTIFVENLRGRLRDLFALNPYFTAIEPGRFKLIILDAFYRFIPRNTDENDNGSVAQLYNQLDHWAMTLGCSFVLIHHASKGSQSGKAVTDVGAGAGSQSRATDTHLVLRAHEQDHVVVLDAAVRSWPPVEPVCLRWDFPVFNPASGLDPTMLRPERPRRKPKEQASEPASQPQQPWDTDRFVRTFISAQAQTRSAIIESAEKSGLSQRRAETLLKRATETRQAYAWTFASNEPVRYADVPQPLLDVPTKGKRRRTKCKSK